MEHLLNRIISSAQRSREETGLKNWTCALAMGIIGPAHVYQ
jgi:hypothetical protein